jgi:hypothetical protein
VRALCRHFGANAVVIIGSQAILATFPDAPALMRGSAEIDAYPENAGDWEARHSLTASEEINANFGYLSPFHEAHGFYIDGVDETTAVLPPGWRDRQNLMEVNCDGRTVYAVTPEVHDLVVSKLCRLDPKDREYVAALHADISLDLDTLRQRIGTVTAPEEVKDRARAYVNTLARQ